MTCLAQFVIQVPAHHVELKSEVLQQDALRGTVVINFLIVCQSNLTDLHVFSEQFH